MEKNRVRINVAGSTYTILSEEEESYVKAIGEEVDKKISEIKKRSSDISSLMAAILTAMDFCDLYRKSLSEKNKINNENKNHFNITESLRKENSLLREKIGDLEMKLRAINMKNNVKK